MVISIALMGAGVRYHRVYDGKKYIGLIVIKHGEYIAKVVGRLDYPKRFKTKDAAASWIHKTYWNQEFPS